MVSERNRILEITKYFQSLGIEVNVGKNKARGNKGFFKACNKSFRIDIAKGQSEEVILKTLVHEFAHFIHYSYDNTLKSLDFIIDENDELTEELIKLTVESIPKDSVAPIFKAKEAIKSEISKSPNSFKLKYLQKELRRINSKISRLNRYYNSPTELFARSIETYLLNREMFIKNAPNLAMYYEQKNIPLIENLNKILLQNC